MKTFYLLRHIDVHGNSGTGVCAEGAVFDNGMAALTWLSNIPTITTFRSIVDVELLHGHGGLTEVIVEGHKKDLKKFEQCRIEARKKKNLLKKKGA